MRVNVFSEVVDFPINAFLLYNHHEEIKEMKFRKVQKISSTLWLLWNRSCQCLIWVANIYVIIYIFFKPALLSQDSYHSCNHRNEGWKLISTKTTLGHLQNTINYLIQKIAFTIKLLNANTFKIYRLLISAQSLGCTESQLWWRDTHSWTLFNGNPNSLTRGGFPE